MNDFTLLTIDMMIDKYISNIMFINRLKNLKAHFHMNFRMLSDFHLVHEMNAKAFGNNVLSIMHFFVVKLLEMLGEKIVLFQKALHLGRFLFI